MISIYKLQNVSPYCLIKQVNKILGIRNSEIWLFDDVSKIFDINLISFQLFTWVKETMNASYAMKPSDTLKIYICTPKKYTKGSNSSAINVVRNYSIIEG